MTHKEHKSLWWCPKCNKPCRMSLDSWPGRCGNESSDPVSRSYCGEEYLILNEDTNEYESQKDRHGRLWPEERKRQIRDFFGITATEEIE